jgi:(2Fe-2S) ferredoxin
VTVRIRVCRDCCCGTSEKHPDVDHDALLAELIAGTSGHADVGVTTCLLACDHSNVVVVSPGPHWFGGVLTRQAVADVAAWVRAGGPELALPKTLERHRIRPPLQASAPASWEATRDDDAGA